MSGRDLLKTLENLDDDTLDGYSLSVRLDGTNYYLEDLVILCSDHDELEVGTPFFTVEE